MCGWTTIEFDKLVKMCELYSKLVTPSETTKKNVSKTRVKHMSNETMTPTAPVTENKSVVIKHNNVDVTISRTETERVKEGDEATVYWNIDLTQFDVTEIRNEKGEVTRQADPLAIWRTLDMLLGHDTMLDKLQAKLNG